jgi:tetratricopeptide (TPR) repeat protein
MAAHKMTRRRTFQWAAVCAAAIGLASIFAIARLSHRPRLPAPAVYGNLPAPFNKALQGARERADSRGRAADSVRDLAHLYQANRLFAEARECYGVIAASRDGLTARDHYCLAAIAQDESDLPRAQAELRAELVSEPGYVPARLALADALFKGGLADEAAKEYAAVLAGEADQPQASFGMARVELQRGDDDGAVARLRTLVARHPESTSGSALLAQLLDRRGDAEGAAAMRQLGRQTHEPVPSDPWMKFMLVDCYDLQRLGIAFEEYRLAGQMDEALPLLDRLEELNPGGWIPPMLHGWSQKEAGHYPEAVEEYKTALKRGGDPERICPLLVAALLTEGKAAEAAALLADYHSKMPRSVPILLSYSEVAVRMKDEKLARSLLSEVLREDPYLYMPNMSMVQILWSSGERDAAAQCLMRVARVFPSDVDSRGLLGQFYMEKSDPWSAIAPLEQALAVVQKGNPARERLTRMLDTAYLTAGSMEASRGQYPSAVKFAEASIRLVPEGLRGYSLKANVCRRTGDFKGALAALARMSAIDPSEPSIQLSLGDVAYQDGDHDLAREHWQRALQLAPASADDLRGAASLRLSGHIPAELLR